MSGQIRSPNFSPWEAEKDRHEEEDHIENRIDSDEGLCQPPEDIALDGQENPQDEKKDR